MVYDIHCILHSIACQLSFLCPVRVLSRSFPQNYSAALQGRSVPFVCTNRKKFWTGALASPSLRSRCNFGTFVGLNYSNHFLIIPR